MQLHAVNQMPDRMSTDMYMLAATLKISLYRQKYLQYMIKCSH